MRKTIRTLVLATVAASALGACAFAPPLVLITNDLRGPRLFRYSMQPTNVEINRGQRLFNLFLQVCNVNPDGTDSNCQIAPVVLNVVPNTVY